MRIKCPHCNGKGFSEINSALNMTCGWCMGQGELDLEIVPTESQTEAEIEKKWENTVWDTDIYLDDIYKLDEKKHKCGSAKQCQFGEMCKPSYDIGGCNHFKQKRPQTNEEWIKQCNTEQLARWIVKIVDCDYCPVKQTKCKNNVPCIAQIEKWLKQPHTNFVRSRKW